MKRIVRPGAAALAAAMAITAALAMTLAGTARAEYPEKPVQFIVPWPPGDLEDVLTRMIAEELQNETGVARRRGETSPGGGGGPVPGCGRGSRGRRPMATRWARSSSACPPSVRCWGSRASPATRSSRLESSSPIRSCWPPRGDAPYSDMAGLAAHAKDNKVALGHFGYGLVPTRVSIIAGMELDFEFGSGRPLSTCWTATPSRRATPTSSTPRSSSCFPCLEEITPLASITGGAHPGAARYAHHGRAGSRPRHLPVETVCSFRRATPQAVKDKLAAVAERVVMSDKAQKLSQETGALVYWQNAEQAAARIDADYARDRGDVQAHG